MAKVTLNRETFKALASDARLDILRTLDGKKMSLKDISKATTLNKATLHEHLSKLHEVGLVKRKGREGHKWVYYKLSWKGECLLHPENTRIVVLFSVTFISLFFGIIQLVNFAKGKIVGLATTVADKTEIYAAEETGLVIHLVSNFKHVADVPLQNQTNYQLSQALSENATLKGALGNIFPPSDIQWAAPDSVRGAFNYGKGSAINDALGSAESEASSNAPALIAFVYDKALLYIGVACLIIFIILLSIGIWRLWKNKTPKL